MNVHLDVFNAFAREQQARMLCRELAMMRARFPTTAVLLTGDFNGANSHAEHDILTSASECDGGGLVDAWDVCEATHGACHTNGFPATFHGWLGASVVDSHLVRCLSFVLHTVHAAGVKLPSVVQWPSLRDLKEIVLSLNPFRIAASMPRALHRLHVDWILVDARCLVPTMVAVAHTRNSEFSSDHFPLVATLQLVC